MLLITMDPSDRGKSDSRYRQEDYISRRTAFHFPKTHLFTCLPILKYWLTPYPSEKARVEPFYSDDSSRILKRSYTLV